MAVPSPSPESKSELRAEGLRLRRDFARSLTGELRAELEGEGDGTAMAVCSEYPLTPQRQVGTICFGPGPGQGQLPRM